MPSVPLVAVAVYFAVGAGLVACLCYKLHIESLRKRIASGWYTLTGQRGNLVAPVVTLSLVAFLFWPLMPLVWWTDRVEDRRGR